MASDRRQVPRYIFNGKGQIFTGEGGSTPNVVIHSLSVQGCRVEGKGLPDAGQKCELRIDWQGKQFRAEADVAWKKSQDLAGLKFSSVDDQNLAILRSICRSLQLEPLRKLVPKPEPTGEPGH